MDFKNKMQLEEEMLNDSEPSSYNVRREGLWINPNFKKDKRRYIPNDKTIPLKELLIKPGDDKCTDSHH